MFAEEFTEGNQTSAPVVIMAEEPQQPPVQPDLTTLFTQMLQMQRDESAARKEEQATRKEELALEKRKLALAEAELKDRRKKDEAAEKERDHLRLLASKQIENDERSKTDRIIDRIPHMREGQDVEHFLQSVEVELLQASIPKSRWKQIISSRLIPKVKNCVLETITSTTATYDDLKARIFKRAGKSRNEIGSKLFFTLTKDSQGRTYHETFQQIHQLVDRFFFEDSNKTEVLTHLKTALLRTTMNLRQQDLLDTKVLGTLDDLADFCDQIDAMEVTRCLERGNDGYYQRHPQQQRHQQQQGKWCSHCRRNNHSTAECRYLNNNSQVKPSGNKVICFHCQEPGHTRPECPKRVQVKKEPKQEKETYNLKVPKIEKKVNVTICREKPKLVSGQVNGETCNVLLDSGADIAVIPDYLVEPDQLLQEFYLVQGMHGHLIQ